MTYRVKAELASYQVKDVAQALFTQWMDSRLVESTHLEWEKLKEAFLERYFPREKREVKIEKFINLRQGSMSVEELYSMFILLSNYVTSLVSYTRD